MNLICYLLVFCLIFVNQPLTQANSLPNLQAPGQMVALSPAFSPAVLKGIKLDPHDPYRFHFYVDSGDSSYKGKQLKSEASRLIKYFLASLTVPEKDLWVNLSPYEKDRIVPTVFGQTEMGRDLLAQDYLLKQITASLIYPESQTGRQFWAKVYTQAQAKYGTTDIPINTFNKVWIVPEKAVVYENGGTAFVLENHLKVMLEQDYLALSKSIVIASPKGDTNTLGSQIVREIVIPALTKEVNEGKNFAPLRQVFYSLILATWYKNKIKGSLLNEVYSNRNRIGGVNVPARDKGEIYQAYLKAFKKGVYNLIKEDRDLTTGQAMPRKYFSGGVEAAEKNLTLDHRRDISLRDLSKSGSLEEIDADIGMISNRAMVSDEQKKLISGFFFAKSKHRIEEVKVFAESLGFKWDDFLRILLDMNEEEYFKPDPVKNPKGFTSFIFTRNKNGDFTGYIENYWSVRKQREDAPYYDCSVVHLFSARGTVFLAVRGRWDAGRLEAAGAGVNTGLDSREAGVREISGEAYFKPDINRLHPVIDDRNPQRGSFRYDFNDTYTKEEIDFQGGYHGPITAGVRHEFYTKYKIILSSQEEQEWKQVLPVKNMKIITLRQFINGETRNVKANDAEAEVRSIVEANPQDILNLSQEQRSEFLSHGFRASLSFAPIRRLLQENADKLHRATVAQGGNKTPAMAAAKGGIDFNPAQMSLQVRNQGEDFKFDFNGTTMDAAQVTGAAVTIRRMTQVVNLQQILGLN